jgi:glutathione S-transferase
VADAYLTTVLNWSIATPMIDFGKYPAVKDYLERMKKRPSVAKALAEEFALYQAEIARHKAAA